MLMRPISMLAGITVSTPCKSACINLAAISNFLTAVLEGVFASNHAPAECVFKYAPVLQVVRTPRLVSLRVPHLCSWS